MSKAKIAWIALVFTFMGLLLWPATPPLMAQDQQPREIQQTAGPYEVGVLTERSNLSVGRARFIITIDDPATGEPVDGVEIVIRIKHQADGTEGWAAAYSVPTFPGTYHAQTRFDSPGVYLVSIEIQGELGKGTVLVEPLNVPDLRGYSSGSIVFVALTLVLVAGAVYIFWNAARQKKRREALAVSAGPSGEEPAGQGGQGPGGDGRD
jgi:hypothetical protein